MADDTNTAEREAFEAWHRTTNWPSDLGQHEGRYMSNIADASWQAWQARASLAASAGSEPVAPGRHTMPETWSVVASVHGVAILSIGYDWVSGKELNDAEIQAVIGMAQHLLAFVGYGLPPSNFDPDADDKEAAHPSPSEGMAGWKPMATAPKDCLVDILNAGRRYAGCHYDRICDEYRHITACGVLIRLKNATHWMPAPPIPASEAKEL